MEDDAPVIYGLEFQARALTPQTAETDAIRFLVGTQSLKYDNQIHIIDFDDENNIINKNVLLHQVGEIWHISASPADKGVLATCYNKIADSRVLTCAAVWRMPEESEPGSHESPDESSSTAHALELLCDLDSVAAHGSVACVVWEPTGDGTRVISLADNHLLLWDLQASSSRALEPVPRAGLGHLSGADDMVQAALPKSPECGNDAGRDPDPSAHLLSLRHAQSSELGHQTRGLFPCTWVWGPQASPCLRRCLRTCRLEKGGLEPVNWGTGGPGPVGWGTGGPGPVGWGTGGPGPVGWGTGGPGPVGWGTGRGCLLVEGIGRWVPSSLLVWQVWVQPLRGAPRQEEPRGQWRSRTL
ncbi:EARP and GARP complex-interacting protein 1 isoform X4 [Myotis myotis]|uniref:EARP and GARP complex-interacting protein 1 isoform X4 n=1 Tax=Myotis myotis TaxID=51298 RepID=UPI001748EC91|nr:EARP and GARP complex-interacting protein 1 isoform X4 [Myotis myotis]